MKPILCLDFDGVLHSYKNGWKGAGVIPDPPVPGAVAFVENALESFQVIVFSSRSQSREGRAAMRDWCEVWGFPVQQISFPAQKPAAFLSIDDRAWCFQGKFPPIEMLLKFRPWNK